MPNVRSPRLRRSWIILIAFAIVIALNQIPLPFYYSQPGEAASLDGMITVEEGYEDQGVFYLTTIRQRRANVPLYVWSQFSSYRDVTPTENFLREGETDEEYFHRQELMMESSQQAAKIAAYKAAGRDYEVDYSGVKVAQVIEGMDAVNHLQENDLITKLNGQEVQTLEEMNAILDGMEAGTNVELTVMRDGKTKHETVTIDQFPEDLNSSGGAGLGLLYPYTKRDVHFQPDVEIDSGSIGGPSAGLMFSLEIYNQLTESDLTNGLDIAGTGTIDEKGNVGRIGGIGQKIIAADNSGVDIFFAPDGEDVASSNYDTAVETAEEIDASMKIVPVRTMEDAVSYLKNREETAS